MKLANFAHRAVRKLRNLTVIDRRKAFEILEADTLRQVFEKFQVDCVFDVGANAGQYARRLLTCPPLVPRS